MGITELSLLLHLVEVEVIISELGASSIGSFVVGSPVYLSNPNTPSC